MAVTAHQETFEGRTLSGALRESLKYQRSFAVEVDSPNTPLLDIAKAPGVKLGDPHPENALCVAQNFSVSHRGGAALLYSVRFNYDVYRQGQKTYSKLPAPVWSGGSTVTQVGLSFDRTGKRITNSAGTPLPDQTQDIGEATLTLERCYPDTGFATMQQAIANLTNTINNATWAGGAAKTWKCQGASWEKVVEPDEDGAESVYYRATFTFAYQALTWVKQLLDIGTQQLVDANGQPSKTGTERAAIAGADNKPVREPVPLDDGIAYTGAPNAGVWPKTLAFDIYVERDFTTSFGTPS
jgi:hypothetical protein